MVLLMRFMSIWFNFKLFVMNKWFDKVFVFVVNCSFFLFVKCLNMGNWCCIIFLIFMGDVLNVIWFEFILEKLSILFIMLSRVLVFFIVIFIYFFCLDDNVDVFNVFNIFWILWIGVWILWFILVRKLLWVVKVFFVILVLFWSVCKV